MSAAASSARRGCIGAREDALELRHAGERFAQAREVARARGAQRDAPGDALDVRHVTQPCVERAVRPVARLAAELLDRFVAGGDDRAVAKRMVEPLPQQPAAHAGRAPVDPAHQRRCRRAAQRLGELEVAARRRIHAEIEPVALGRERDDVPERLRLRAPRVAEQRAGRGDRRPQVLAAETRKPGNAEVFREQAARAVEIELPRRKSRHRTGLGELDPGAVGDEDLGRPDPLELVRELAQRDLRHAELAAREVEPCQAGELALRVHGEEEVVGLVVEERAVGQRARRDDARHRALDRPFRGRRIADLLADRRRLAELHQLREVLLDRLPRARPPSGSAPRRTRRGWSA